MGCPWGRRFSDDKLSGGDTILFKEGEDLICFDGIEDLCEKQNIIWHMRKNVWQSQKMVIEK